MRSDAPRLPRPQPPATGRSTRCTRWPDLAAAERTDPPRCRRSSHPPQLFEELHARHRFTVDAAASTRNAKLPRFWTIDDDGLEQSWAGERVWCNPPYSDIRPWVEKASEGDAELVVMILPANRTEQAWWQDLVEPHRDHYDGGIVTRYLRGRLRFDGIEHPADGKGNRPPFGCVLLGWGCEP